MITISIPCQFLELSQSISQAINKNSQLNWNMFSLQTRVWRKQKIMAYWLVCIQHHHLISLLSCVCSANSAELSKLSQASAAKPLAAQRAAVLRKNTTYSEEEAWNAWQGTSRTCCRKPLAVICMPACHKHSGWLVWGLKFTLNLFNTFANLLIDCHEERINQSSERYAIRHFSDYVILSKGCASKYDQIWFSDTLLL